MKSVKRPAVLVLAVIGIAGLTGCGGFQASRTISPLDMLLPGLVGTEPTKGTPAADHSDSAENQPAPHLAVASVR
jgi:hypothetical protein